MKVHFLIVIMFLFFSGCYSQQASNTKFDLGKLAKSSTLLKELNEISSLAVNSNGKLFCNQDESGIIYQLNPYSGKVIKKFFIGHNTIDRDFEGLAIVDSTFYLITSSGLLFIFNEGKNNEAVTYKTKKLNFSKKFNIEGLCYDPLTQSLLIAAKDYPGKNLKGNRAVYSYSLIKNKVNPNPRFIISLKALKNKFNLATFYPSAIETLPDNSGFLILSSKGEKAIIQISNNGDIIAAVKLKKKHHRQPEGITFLQDGNLAISDEANGKKAKLTIYKLR